MLYTRKALTPISNLLCPLPKHALKPKMGNALIKIAVPIPIRAFIETLSSCQTHRS
jgi:hypothetical protein